MSHAFDDARPEQCWNFGLAHDHLLMFASDDVRNPEMKNKWLEQLERTQISPEYSDFFRRWRATLDGPSTRRQTCEAASRLFVGHGNPSGSEVGLTVHHTWGAPVIPGSALKGLLAHRVTTLYGAQSGDEDPERERWRGVTWNKNRITRGPGDLYRVLFGAPDAEDADETSGACAGSVIFHDALYVPRAGEKDHPFARDVLTVHQKSYYDSCGASAPNDYDDPNPVGFLNVKPGARFLLALSGPADWTELAMQLLLEALEDWGVGGKTSLGYGRLLAVDEHAASASVATKASPNEDPQPIRAGPSQLLVEFEAALKGKKGVVVRETLELMLDQWPERLDKLDDKERRRAANSLNKKSSKLKKARDNALKARLNEWIARLRGESADPT
ncbi:type III-B CRISPR module RAMP protein Cmr6 [Enhygromyxa salina]|uniref:type III-B CRISPR module RAMP protein Cmr6 n=1 Tax=Enhygromyxa salina TaxID=215803 RepID=UPI0015E5DEE9|nr:type III-B CRISPR module RAMP protein Cmr6 [Enhygromyxa salina]